MISAAMIPAGAADRQRGRRSDPQKPYKEMQAVPFVRISKDVTVRQNKKKAPRYLRAAGFADGDIVELSEDALW